jgi:hypothetical protein
MQSWRSADTAARLEIAPEKRLMIRKQTVLVLGAGASVPYGFPTNDGLVRAILDGCREQNTEFRISMCAAGAGDAEITEFHRALERTQLFSIDAFLEHQPRFADLGKLAIATALIPKELPDQLMAASEHWYRLLFNHLVGPRGFSASKLTVITFNYDRSLEQYLFMTVQQEFQLSVVQARGVLASAKFIHVHGDLGLLEWRPTNLDVLVRPYTPESTAETLRAAAKRILTVGDISRRGQSDELKYYLHSTLYEAEVIGFLGFGYHDVLIERLGISEVARKRGSDVAIYGSGFRLPRGRRSELQRSIDRIDLGADNENTVEFLQSSTLCIRPLSGNQIKAACQVEELFPDSVERRGFVDGRARPGLSLGRLS